MVHVQFWKKPAMDFCVPFVIRDLGRKLLEAEVKGGKRLAATGFSRLSVGKRH